MYSDGAYREIGGVSWSRVERLVFACKGNICRSAYASAKARSLGVSACSFGLHAVDGAPADPAAIRNAAARLLDLTAHRSTQATTCKMTATDLVVVFEPSQIIEARRYGEPGTQFTLLGLWSRPVRPWIQDPYGRSDRYFQRCFSVIDAAVLEFANRTNHGLGRGTWPCESGKR